jgi:lysophospholipase L1-like esterase
MDAGAVWSTAVCSSAFRRFGKLATSPDRLKAGLQTPNNSGLPRRPVWANQIVMNTLSSLKRLTALALATALACGGGARCAAQTTNATNAEAAVAAAPRTNTAIIPKLSSGFMRQHTNFVEIAKKGDIDVLFMGDSITDWWRSAAPQGGRNVFQKYFGDQKVANFGIAGDRTQGVLWRLQNGEGEGYKPKVIMLMIGTNNTDRNTGGEIAEGVAAVVAELRKDFPDAKILLLAIFPRSTPGNNLRKIISEANAEIAKLNDLDHVFYLDIGGKFLGDDGKFLPGVFRNDNLHPVEKGYEIWAEAVKEPLANLMAAATAVKPAAQ